MIRLIGRRNEAKIFTNDIEEAARLQIFELLDNENFKDSKIRFMPDIHAGNGCVIGTTMTITDKVVPNFVGVDIGCGVLAVQIMEHDIDFEKLDGIIKNYVPSGFSVHNTPNKRAHEIDLSQLRCANHVNINRAYKSIGTLGGGNHFIEVAKGAHYGNRYLIIHSGSRNIGKQIAEYYQELAYKQMKNNQLTKNDIAIQLTHLGREQDIERILKSTHIPEINKSMAYCAGELMCDYLHDMDIAQKYASLNRSVIAEIICVGMRWKTHAEIETVHNYIDMETMILRKGAVRANKNENVIIPMNMSFGSIIGIGKGNEDWNNSCAHGSGRTMSRTVAKKNISMDEYKKSMEGIFTTCVNSDTIDESPMAYKNPNIIVEQLRETIDVSSFLKPIYNFKASENNGRRR